LAGGEDQDLTPAMGSPAKSRGAKLPRYNAALRARGGGLKIAAVGRYFWVGGLASGLRARTRERGKLTRQSVITQEGLEKLKEEIEYLTTTKRREVADRIKESREFGDIAENAEYDDAKNEQALLEQRIAQLEERLRRATVVDNKKVDTEHVGVGTLVHVKDQKSGDSQKFQIVGSTEADPAEHKLSNESPIGGALIGRKRGEVVSVEVPRGPKRKLKITKIEAA
jgi:transcription elongation factor GreA